MTQSPLYTPTFEGWTIVELKGKALVIENEQVTAFLLANPTAIVKREIADTELQGEPA